MRHRPGMTFDQRQMTIGMLIGGISARNVERHFGAHTHRSKINRIQTRHQKTGHVADRPPSRRPRKSSPREDKFYIMTFSRRNCFWSSSNIATQVQNVIGTRIPFRTGRNHLRSAGLRAYRPAA